MDPGGDAPLQVLNPSEPKTDEPYDVYYEPRDSTPKDDGSGEYEISPMPRGNQFDKQVRGRGAGK